MLSTGGEGICPPGEVDSSGDGVVTTAEAARWLGEPRLVLTTEGDFGPELALDVDRVPVVTPEGEVVFERSFDLAEVDPFGLDSTAIFAVERVVCFPKDRFPTGDVYRDTADAQLRLITCGGAFDRGEGSYRDNVVVFARLVAPR